MFNVIPNPYKVVRSKPDDTLLEEAKPESARKEERRPVQGQKALHRKKLEIQKYLGNFHEKRSASMGELPSGRSWSLKTGMAKTRGQTLDERLFEANSLTMIRDGIRVD
jgi:hypothetical protein